MSGREDSHQPACQGGEKCAGTGKRKNAHRKPLSETVPCSIKTACGKGRGTEGLEAAQISEGEARGEQSVGS